MVNGAGEDEKDEGGRLVLPAPVPQAQVSEVEGMKDEWRGDGSCRLSLLKSHERDLSKSGIIFLPADKIRLHAV